MKRVFICSPYKGTPDEVRRNVAAAEEVCRFAVSHGLAPFAPHLLYTRFLNEQDAKERAAGIEAGKGFVFACDELWAVTLGRDGDITDGMREEIEHALKVGVPVRPLRLIDGVLTTAFKVFGGDQNDFEEGGV